MIRIKISVSIRSVTFKFKNDAEIILSSKITNMLERHNECFVVQYVSRIARTSFSHWHIRLNNRVARITKLCCQYHWPIMWKRTLQEVEQSGWSYLIGPKSMIIFVFVILTKYELAQQYMLRASIYSRASINAVITSDCQNSANDESEDSITICVSFLLQVFRRFGAI